MVPYLHSQPPRAITLSGPHRVWRAAKFDGVRFFQLTLGTPLACAWGLALIYLGTSFILGIPKHFVATALFALATTPLVYYFSKILRDLIKGRAQTIVVTADEVLWGRAPAFAPDGPLILADWKGLRRVKLSELRSVRYYTMGDRVVLDPNIDPETRLPTVLDGARSVAELIASLAPSALLAIDDLGERDWGAFFRDHRAKRIGLPDVSHASPWRYGDFTDPGSLVRLKTSTGSRLGSTFVALFLSLASIPVLAAVAAGIAKRNIIFLWAGLALSGGLWEILRLVFGSRREFHTDLIFDFESRELRFTRSGKSRDTGVLAFSLEDVMAISCEKILDRSADEREKAIVYRLCLILNDGTRAFLSATQSEGRALLGMGTSLAQRLGVSFWEYPDPREV